MEQNKKIRKLNNRRSVLPLLCLKGPCQEIIRPFLLEYLVKKLKQMDKRTLYEALAFHNQRLYM